MKEIIADVDGLLWLTPNARDTREYWIQVFDPETNKVLQSDYLPVEMKLVAEDGELVQKGDVIARPSE